MQLLLQRKNDSKSYDKERKRTMMKQLKVLFRFTKPFILINNNMETNEQTNAPDDSEATVDTEENLEVLSATRQRIRQLISDYFAL
jgi:hypothetical protein